MGEKYIRMNFHNIVIVKTLTYERLEISPQVLFYN